MLDTERHRQVTNTTPFPASSSSSVSMDGGETENEKSDAGDTQPSPQLGRGAFESPELQQNDNQFPWLPFQSAASPNALSTDSCNAFLPELLELPPEDTVSTPWSTVRSPVGGARSPGLQATSGLNSGVIREGGALPQACGLDER